MSLSISGRMTLGLNTGNQSRDQLLAAALRLRPVWLYDHKDITSFFRDTAMTVPAVVGDPVRAVRDKSGNGNHRTSPSDSQSGILRQIGDLYYIESDGSNDYMITPSIDLTAMDAVTLCLGFRKLSDATIGILFESSSTMANNGTFGIQAPNPAASINFRASSRGTSTSDAVSGLGHSAPATRVVTLLSDVSADTLILRLNGAQVGTAATDQGTGNYTNTPHYFWMRGGATFPAQVYDFGGVLYASQLSGDDLAAVEEFVTDRTPLPVSQPSGFSWAGAPEILTSSRNFTTSFDLDDYRPSTSVTYYVDPLAGSDSNDGLSEVTPRQKLSTTVTLANTGGVAARFLCKPGVYRGDVGWFGSIPTVNFILEPWAADPTDPENRMWFVLPALPDPWVYDVGDGYRNTGFYASDPFFVFDQKLTDSQGFPLKYEKAGSRDEYLATPGLWWRDTATSRLFIHPFDQRDLRALFLAGQPHQIEVCTTGGGNNLRFDATTNLTMWVQNATFLDGSNIIWVKPSTTGLTITAYMRDVLSVGSVLGDGTAFHSLQSGSTTTVYMHRCGTGYNVADGFDYRGDSGGSVKFFEHECFTKRNGYDTSGANNASTGHGDSVGISLNCNFAGSQNRVINDIDTTTRWMVGGQIGGSLQTDSTAVTVQAGSASGSHTAQIWLQSVIVNASASSTLFATSGSAIRYRGFGIGGVTTGGTGTIEAY